ncbi:MAG: hemin uptake protein HemP [Planctomycetaceae bacterium]|nr:hemin uptake protein HemP [Planctomycetaceae bacterium]
MAPGELPPRDTPHPPSDARSQGHLQRVVSSKEILQGGQEVVIEHEGEFYRLRLTRNGKLILQK